MASLRAQQGTISVQVHEVQYEGFLNSTTGVANFLGIQFATVPARFRQAVLVDLTKTSGVVNATCYGPPCPQPQDAMQGQRSHLYEGIASYNVAPASEFNCLTLNVYAPPATKIYQNLLPVLIWIHGGGWVMGDGNGNYDGNYLVSHAMDLNRPYIHVSINYRLGYFGFLASEELKAEAKTLGEAGYANQGLFDQRLAVEWVKKYIHFFGGDASNITLTGESSGAWSVLAHVKSNVPLGRKVIAMSTPSLPIKSTAAAQETFNRLLFCAGVDASAPAPEKLKNLRDLTCEQLGSFLDSPIGRVVWDTEWFVDPDPSRPIVDLDRLPSWISRMIIGSTKDEFSLLLPLWSTLSARQIAKAIRTASREDEAFAEEVLKTYDINQEDADNTTALRGLFRYGTDSIYTSLLPAPGETIPRKVLIYTFDQVDTFPGTLLEGYSYHSHGNAYFFRFPAVAGPKAPAALRETCDVFSRAIIALLYDDHPWEEYHISGRMMSLDGSKSGLVTRSLPWFRFSDTKERRKKFQEVGEALLDYAIQMYTLGSIPRVP